MTFRPVLWRTFDPDGGAHHYCRKPENVAAEVAWSTPDGRATIHHGDCLDVMPTLDAGGIDAVVCDPPYGLAFMGKEWDHGVPGAPFWIEALRLAKPGAHLLAFGGTRTFHRLTCAIEDAGWEIRDCLSWLYGSGFPKSARVNRDPRFCQCGEPARSGECSTPEQRTGDRIGTEETSGDGALPPVDAFRSTGRAQGSPACCPQAGGSDGELPLRVEAVGQVSPPSSEDALGRTHSGEPSDDRGGGQGRTPSRARRSAPRASTGSPHLESAGGDAQERTEASTSPAGTSESDARKSGRDRSSCAQYSIGFPRCDKCGKPNADGWGTALKPAWEPVVLARKPLIGTVAANVSAHRTGALNIDGCQIKNTKPDTTRGAGGGKGAYSPLGAQGRIEDDGRGRWPANVVLDVKAGRLLDEQTGSLGRSAGTEVGGEANPSGIYRPRTKRERDPIGFGDSGGASRFFYTAKASRSEREAGLDGLPIGVADPYGEHRGRRMEDKSRIDGKPAKRARNVHPTVKPVDLMRWLVRLVTPIGGTVLDPFLGSGTTGVAALQEGCRFIGIEREAQYVEIAKARIAHEAAQGALFGGVS